MTHTQRHDRIKQLQEECDRLIRECADCDCPCPTCEALDDALKAMKDVESSLIVARACAERAADVIEWPMAEVA